MRLSYEYGCLACLACIVILINPAPSLAGTYLGGAKIVLRVGPAVPSEKACLPEYTGVAEDCWAYTPCDPVTTPQSTTRYSLIVARVPEGGSVGGMSLGIEYSDNLSVSFDLCTDGLEFRNNAWPASYGGNRITWGTCGSGLDPAYTDRYATTDGGVQVVFGSFYVYKYGGDGYFNITNNHLATFDELVLGNCNADEFNLSVYSASRIAIGNGSGYNPCTYANSDCSLVPTRPPTWGGIKARYGHVQEAGEP